MMLEAWQHGMDVMRAFCQVALQGQSACQRVYILRQEARDSRGTGLLLVNVTLHSGKTAHSETPAAVLSQDGVPWLQCFPLGPLKDPALLSTVRSGTMCEPQGTRTGHGQVWLCVIQGFLTLLTTIKRVHFLLIQLERPWVLFNDFKSTSVYLITWFTQEYW